MSRTYRRKNYELTQNTSWDRVGRRVYGFNVERDFIIHHGDRYYFYETVYRSATKKEIQDEYKIIHTDNQKSKYDNPPSWFVRLYFEKPLRKHNKRELHRFIRNPDYEPMCEKKSRDALWDWS